MVHRHESVSVDGVETPRTLSVPGNLVVLSGGLDSTVCMALAEREASAPPLALTFDYGNATAPNWTARPGSPVTTGAEHLVVHLDTAAWGGSALTDPSIEVPAGGSTDGIPLTYVPARNTIFLAVALGVAEARDLDAVWIGVNAGRLLRLPRLPARVHRGVPAGGRHRSAARRRGTARSRSGPR